jgi:hypothetical protein
VDKDGRGNIHVTGTDASGDVKWDFFTSKDACDTERGHQLRPRHSTFDCLGAAFGPPFCLLFRVRLWS